MSTKPVLVPLGALSAKSEIDNVLNLKLTAADRRLERPIPENCQIGNGRKEVRKKSLEDSDPTPRVPEGGSCPMMSRFSIPLKREDLLKLPEEEGNLWVETVLSIREVVAKIKVGLDGG